MERKFELTEEAKKIAINHLANNGWLGLCLVRTDKDKFTVAGKHNGVEVLRLADSFFIPEGNSSLEITGVKMKFEIE